MAFRFLDHYVMMRELERKLRRGILCTDVQWPIHVIQRSLLPSGTSTKSPPNFGRCLEVAEHNRYAQARIRVSIVWAGKIGYGMRERFQQDSHPELAEKIEHLLFSLAVMTVYPVVGGYGLSSAIVESTAVHGCGERTRFEIRR